MRLGFWLAIAMGALTAVCASGGCTNDFDQFEPVEGSGGECGAGEKLCGGACVPADDPSYGCGEGCTPCELPDAIAVCASGACAVAQCTSTTLNCDDDAANGCETDFSDPANCGECEVACNPPATCAGGFCLLECSQGMDDCDDDTNNGCETPLGTVTDCGSCGDVCDFANATPTCAQGACAVEECDVDFADCDLVESNGCEADLNTSTEDCGDCAIVCLDHPNSTAACNAGTCGITCVGAYDDCDGDTNNGCEVDTAISTEDCGACGHACPSEFACQAGACACDDDDDCDAGTSGTFSCDPGTGLCACDASTCPPEERCQGDGQCGPDP